MYQPTYTSPSAGYVSPPPTNYRSSPISAAPVQPYSSSFSPPPHLSSMSPIMPPQVQAQRYQQYPNNNNHNNIQYRSSPPQGGPPPPPMSGGSRYASPAQYAPKGSYPNQAPSIPPASQQQTTRYKGTLPPGQIIRVGDQAVKIERYLSEGGYAHVYLTSSEKPIYPPRRDGGKKGRWGEQGYVEHCLKRIAFEDENVWKEVNKEIEVMKTLPTSPYLTTYLASAHSRLPTGGYEVFILMEFCAGGGIIDLLNKRLRDRLQEIEILNIFTDVCEAVAVMHALPQPLIHRDLKIENILSAPISSPPTTLRPTPLIFKLCDFGSTTIPATRPPSSKAEADALAMDLNRHTTLQYRSPEMVEPLLGWPVGLPSDVWALGVLLYKLCYYTTPFEEHGTLAIVNAKYTFPQYPVYSPRLQHLIASLLVEQPLRRPSVFEILRVAHEMSGTKPFIDYPIPSRSISSSQTQNSGPLPLAKTGNLLDFTSSTPSNAPTVPTMVPSIQPQRRGRPMREPIKAQQSPAESSVTIGVSAEELIQQTEPPKQGPKLQVTGDRSEKEPSASEQRDHRQLAPSATPQLDAFGMPAGIKTASQHEGFGNSFDGPKSNVSSIGSKFGSTLRTSPSGFGDSFAAPRSTNGSNGTSQPTPKRMPSFGGNFAPRKATSTSVLTSNRKVTDPASSIPDGETSFEMRFPSIEFLSSEDAFSPKDESPPTLSRTTTTDTVPSTVRPSISRQTTEQQGLLSPSTDRPTIQTKPSFPMRSLTGGDQDITSPHLPTINNVSGVPMPRSTQVTGTAFKGDDNKDPSSPAKSRKDYFEQIGSSSRGGGDGKTSPKPVPAASVPDRNRDLLADEESNGLQVPSLRPTLSTSPSKMSRSSFTSPSLPMPSQTTAPSGKVSEIHTKPKLPTVTAPKPNSNINSEKWSPLENMRHGFPAIKKKDEDSSGEEEGPEDPSSRFGSRRSRFDVGASPQAQVRKNTSLDTDIKTTAPSGSKHSSDTRFRTRPQSMFIPSTSQSDALIQSPSLDDRNKPLAQTTNVTTEQRPSLHTRRSSVTDIVTQFESFGSPTTSNTSKGSRSPGKKEQPKTSATPASSKPSVASKPQALRKTSLASGTGAASQAASNLPASSASPTKSSFTSTARVYTQDGLRRSSTTRPATKPKPIVSVLESPTPLSDTPVSPDQSSPEKQQPVNLLIQRWNQGEVGGKPKVKPPISKKTFI